MRQLYTVASEGVSIPYAGGINGPLSTPTVLPLDTVVTMVRKGYEVYQHNPVNLNEKVLVTAKNVGQVEFKSTKSETVTKRALNKSIQDMNKPMMANVVRKADDNSSNKKYDKYNKKDNKNNNSNDTSAKTETVESEDITKPDVFSKN